jgi:hypothetical protein
MSIEDGLAQLQESVSFLRGKLEEDRPEGRNVAANQKNV